MKIQTKTTAEFTGEDLREWVAERLGVDAATVTIHYEGGVFPATDDKFIAADAKFIASTENISKSIRSKSEQVRVGDVFRVLPHANPAAAAGQTVRVRELDGNDVFYSEEEAAGCNRWYLHEVERVTPRG